MKRLTNKSEKELSPAALSVVLKLKSQKEAINEFFDGKITMSELNSKGVKLVKTI